MKHLSSLFLCIFLVQFPANVWGQDGPWVISTFAGTGTRGFSGDGIPADQAQLNFPSDLDLDPDGNLYIADPGNHRIRRVGPDNLIITFAGVDTAGFSGDGGLAVEASLNFPERVAVDPKGNVYIADTGNQRIRRVGPDGVITTFAGSGARGFSGDGGPATKADMNLPTGLAVDTSGVVYIADSDNHRIRRVDLNGIITTFAGNGTQGFSGDGGQATQALLAFPEGVTIDPSDNVYITDLWNHRIRRVDSNGIITTFAGSGPTGEGGGEFSGDGGDAVLATLTFPEATDLGSDGAVYISDTFNNRIRRVAPDGIITTFAGSGPPGQGGGGYSGDGGLASMARLNLPWGIVVGDGEVIYIADSFNHRIRQVRLGDRSSDFNGDGSVDLNDFFLFARAFGKTREDSEFEENFDLNKNGEVDFDDFFIFADTFGRITD